MYNFKYHRPQTLQETLEIYKQYPDSCLIAGGTDALIQYRSGKYASPHAIDVMIPELIGIHETSDAYVIGASTSLTEVSDYFAKLSQPYRVLHTTAESVGACQTRNLATIGGNICTGNASADMAAPLLVLEAVLVLASTEGERELPIDQFFIKNREIALRSGEILTAIRIPKYNQAFCGAAFMKLGKRRGHVIATLNTAALICADADGVICNAKLAAGTLAPTPIRLYESEKLLLGCSIEPKELEEVLVKVAETMLTEIQPRDSLRASKEYRMSTAPVSLTRTIRMACGQEV